MAAKKRLQIDQDALQEARDVLGHKDAGEVDGRLPAKPHEAETAKTRAPGRTVMDCRVERICPNPTWVKVRVGNALVNVRVANNRAMRPGTMLKACQFEGGVGRFHGRVRA